MSNVLSGLKPAAVFEIFETLTQIPHSSQNTWEISDYLMQFAKEHHLRARQDDVGNVVIWKEATPGYEEAPTVMLQGHMDMVAAVADGVEHDFLKDPLKLRIEGDRVYASGTTLGGDNGIAVAYGLALLIDQTIEHPALECVFTVDEELGMDGAVALDPTDLKSTYMINADSEVEGVFTVSCAGGIRYNVSLLVVRTNQSGLRVSLVLTDLLGGHSGTDIDKNRLNANKGLAEILHLLQEKFPLYLLNWQGGVVDNAIPTRAVADLLVPSSIDFNDFKQEVSKVERIIKEAYQAYEPNLTLQLEKAEGVAAACLMPEETNKVITFMMSLPNGVQTMSKDLPGLVQTSLNMGIVHLEEDFLHVHFAARSSVEKEKIELGFELKELAEQWGGSWSRSSGYEGWAYEPVSPFRELALQTYREMYGKEPVIEAIHAGLECGIFKSKMPQLQIIAIGPDLFDIHSPQESLSISSVARVWEYLVELLRRIK